MLNTAFCDTPSSVDNRRDDFWGLRFSDATSSSCFSTVVAVLGRPAPLACRTLPVASNLCTSIENTISGRRWRIKYFRPPSLDLSRIFGLVVQFHCSDSLLRGKLFAHNEKYLKIQQKISTLRQIENTDLTVSHGSNRSVYVCYQAWARLTLPYSQSKDNLATSHWGPNQPRKIARYLNPAKCWKQPRMVDFLGDCVM
jgi:hypothetical protein